MAGVVVVSWDGTMTADGKRNPLGHICNCSPEVSDFDQSSANMDESEFVNPPPPRPPLFPNQIATNNDATRPCNAIIAPQQVAIIWQCFQGCC